MWSVSEVRIDSARPPCSPGLGWLSLALDRRCSPCDCQEVVEDLALGAYLTRIGRPPIYLDQALVESVAATEQATLAQRTRWEVRFVTIARSMELAGLGGRCQDRKSKAISAWASLDGAPPRALMMVAFAILVAVAILAWITGQWAPLAAIAARLHSRRCVFCSIGVSEDIAGLG